ncbi:MAG: hypothetical protein KBT11_11805 [Treponema sp.]|nr:hypothetical protein [Candidatus Treponema equifaecale]
MKKIFVIFATFFSLNILPIFANTQTIGAGLSVPVQYLQFSEQSGFGTNYDLDVQYRFFEETGPAYYFDLALGIGANDLFKDYEKEMVTFFHFGMFIGYGYDLLKSVKGAKLVASGILGFESNNSTYKQGSLFSHKKVSQENFNINAGLDLYFCKSITSSLGIFLDVKGYAGFGASTLEEKNTDIEDRKFYYTFAAVPSLGCAWKF